MRKANILNKIIIICFLWGCSSKHPDWNGGVIKEFGVYKVPKLNYTIEVYEHDGLLNYFIKDLSGKRIVLGPTYGTSTYQKWAMYFDKNNDLWIESSDIGSSLWKYIGPGEYKEVDLEKEPKYMDSIPKEIKRRK